MKFFISFKSIVRRFFPGIAHDIKLWTLNSFLIHAISFPWRACERSMRRRVEKLMMRLKNWFRNCIITTILLPSILYVFILTNNSAWNALLTMRLSRKISITVPGLFWLISNPPRRTGAENSSIGKTSIACQTLETLQIGALCITMGRSICKYAKLFLNLYSLAFPLNEQTMSKIFYIEFFDLSLSSSNIHNSPYHHPPTSKS